MFTKSTCSGPVQALHEPSFLFIVMHLNVCSGLFGNITVNKSLHKLIDLLREYLTIHFGKHFNDIY